ncbi:hypothetical protein Sango_3036900 [Sesamum angolense]|uniref:Retroviral polymerase SH3-like domain-containing protein n=1 Tax=Sesamum angolense TaxID=2727404 RepID=A0AAE1TBY4_9LAMI|nr:hypothetical protein Sango_3036900 [Sesamum angolense]
MRRDFENQGYVLDNPLPTALLEGSSPEQRVTFEKWLEDNFKVRSIILASMTNEIQKQYDRLDDVPSIMLRMKEVYAVPHRHIRYAATKAFFRTKMTKGSSVQSHGVKMLSLVDKLEDLKAGLDNDTYIDVILQPLPSSYNPFIINYNMNGLVKTIHELINMLVQYKAMTHNSALMVLVGEASTSKAKGKRVGRWKRKKGKEKAITATASAEVPLLLLRVLERSRRLSKDEMIIRLGDGKAVAVEAMGSLSLVINDHIRIELKDCYYVPNAIRDMAWGSLAYVKRLVGDKLDSRSSMCKFVGYPKETMGYYFYDQSEQNIFISRNAVFLKKGFPTDSRREEVLLEESSEVPQQNDATSFEPSVPTDGVPILHRSIRESRPPDRYGFMGLTSQFDNDPRT